MSEWWRVGLARDDVLCVLLMRVLGVGSRGDGVQHRLPLTTDAGSTCFQVFAVMFSRLEVGTF